MQMVGTLSGENNGACKAGVSLCQMSSRWQCIIRDQVVHPSVSQETVSLFCFSGTASPPLMVMY